MPSLQSFVDQGIAFEDEFIETYLKVLRDEGFVGLFGAHQDEARVLLTTMIDESGAHRAALERLKEGLS
jgi:hypothetical protein